MPVLLVGSMFAHKGVQQKLSILFFNIFLTSSTGIFLHVSHISFPDIFLRAETQALKTTP